MFSHYTTILSVFQSICLKTTRYPMKCRIMFQQKLHLHGGVITPPQYFRNGRAEICPNLYARGDHARPCYARQRSLKREPAYRKTNTFLNGFRNIVIIMAVIPLVLAMGSANDGRAKAGPNLYAREDFVRPCYARRQSLKRELRATGKQTALLEGFFPNTRNAALRRPQ